MLQLFTSITTLAFDVDGVLTDGTVLVLPGGVQARKMSVRDGYALQLAVKKGYRVLVISGGDSPEVKDRLLKLGVTDVFMQVKNKAEQLQQFMSDNNIMREQVLFMGDDIPDLEVMQLAGLACCPADAVREIRSISTYISHLNGGAGCARDVIEKVMKLRGHWTEDTSVQAK